MGSIQPFEAFFRAHYIEVLRFVERRVVDGEDAVDLAADVFRIAWQRFTPGFYVSRAWLFGIARNVVLAHYRTVGRRTAAFERYEREQRLEAEGSSHQSPRLLEALGQMPDVDQEALRLQYWEGLSTREIAEVLDLSHSAVRVRLHRAKKRLRALLSGMEVGES